MKRFPLPKAGEGQGEGVIAIRYFSPSPNLSPQGRGISRLTFGDLALSK
jgi:hypothetical protein